MAAEGALVIAAEDLLELRNFAFDTMDRTVAMVRASAPALEILEDEGMRFVVSKGPGIALASEHVSERPFSDVDVIIDPADYQIGLKILRSIGYEEQADTRLPWRWCDNICREAVNLRNSDGGSIDLHHHVPPWLWTRNIEMSNLLLGYEIREFAGIDLRLASPEVNLLISALHVVSDRGRPGKSIMAWRDVLSMMRASTPSLVLNLAESWELVGWLRMILAELPEGVRPVEFWELVRQRADPLSSSIRLRAYLYPGIASRHRIGHAFRLPTPNAIAYLAAMTFPSPSFLALKGYAFQTSYIAWWRDSIRRTRKMEACADDAAMRVNASQRPRVVYWNNQPSPYVVARFNAVADRGEVDLIAWFDGRREPDRSWDVDESSWRFEYRYLDSARSGRRHIALPSRTAWNPTPDVLVTSLDRPSGVIGAILGRSFAKRVALRTLPAYRSWEGRATLLNLVRHAVYRSVDGCKVSGRDASTFARSFGLPRNRHWPVRQSIDVDVYREALNVGALERIERRSTIGLTGCVFVYVGRLWKGKGLTVLLEAFAEIERELHDAVSLLIIGDGPEELALRAFAAEIGGIHFAGFVQPSELAAWLALGDGFVFPTLGDPNGVVVEEAMAAGLPVLATDAAGDIVQRVRERGAGFVVPSNNSNALKWAMRTLATDPELRAQMKARALEASEEYRVEMYARDFTEFVRGILEREVRPGALAWMTRVLGRVLGALHLAERVAGSDDGVS